MVTELETRKVSGGAWGFTLRESDPTQVYPYSSPRPILTQKWGKGKDKEREETYFEMTSFLSRKEIRERTSTGFRVRRFAQGTSC